MNSFLHSCWLNPVEGNAPESVVTMIFNCVYCQIFVKSEGMFLLCNENLSVQTRLSGDVEII